MVLCFESCVGLCETMRQMSITINDPITISVLERLLSDLLFTLGYTILSREGQTERFINKSISPTITHVCSMKIEYELVIQFPNTTNYFSELRPEDKHRIRIRIPVDPAGECCYGSSAKPCKSEDSQESRLNAQ